MSEPIGLTAGGRARLTEPMTRRELVVHVIVGTSLLLGAALLAAIGTQGAVHALDVALFVIAAAVMGRLEFETGSGYLEPTQLIFVPMLFVLPAAIVPLVVVAALVLADLPDVVTRRL